MNQLPQQLDRNTTMSSAATDQELGAKVRMHSAVQEGLANAEAQRGLQEASKMDAYMTAIGQDPSGVAATRLIEANPHDKGMILAAEDNVLSSIRQAQNGQYEAAQSPYADQYRSALLQGQGY